MSQLSVSPNRSNYHHVSSPASTISDDDDSNHSEPNDLRAPRKSRFSKWIVIWVNSANRAAHTATKRRFLAWNQSVVAIQWQRQPHCTLCHHSNDCPVRKASSRLTSEMTGTVCASAADTSCLSCAVPIFCHQNMSAEYCLEALCFGGNTVTATGECVKGTNLMSLHIPWASCRMSPKETFIDTFALLL